MKKIIVLAAAIGASGLFFAADSPQRALAASTQETYSGKVTLFERAELYEDAAGTKKTGGTVSPQVVYAISKSGGAYLILTWVGQKWIRPSKLKEGEAEKREETLKFPNREFIYDSPGDSNPIASIAPQSIRTSAKWGDWYQVSTWVGLKWIKPSETLKNSPQPLNQLVRIEKRTSLRKEASSESKSEATIAPQSVYATEKWGSWYKINTWIGPRWVSGEKAFLESEITKKMEALQIKSTADLYDASFEEDKTALHVSPQNVKSFEFRMDAKGVKWSHINTWAGPKWIKAPFAEPEPAKPAPAPTPAPTPSPTPTPAPVATPTPTIPSLDTTAPEQISDLSATNDTATSAAISWKEANDLSAAGQTATGVKGYNIYDGNGNKIASSPGASYEATALAPGNSYTFSVAAYDGAKNEGAKATITFQAGAYSLELAKWGIYNDSTHPVETTKGINAALQWAHDQGFAVFKVPAGTYLVSKGTSETDTSGRINMVSDMTFLLDSNAVVKKETNNYAGYQTMYVGHNVKNAVIKGGTYEGDKLTHDFSAGGTQESGLGIGIEGSANITIDGVKTENFTGDGMSVGGWSYGIGGFAGKHFESGGIDDNGNLVGDASKQRTVKRIYVDTPLFQTQRTITFDQSQNLPHSFNIYFYKQDGTLISFEKNKVQEEWIRVPEGASYFSLVFDKSFDNSAYIMGWTKDVSKNILIKNSESLLNRRQGLTVMGVDGLQVLNNYFHDIRGTAPGAGIDVESEGFFPDNNLLFKGNKISNNAGPSIVVCDGSNIVLDGNTLETTPATIWNYIKGATVNNNTFNNSGIHAMTAVSASNNVLNNSSMGLDASGSVVDGLTGTDGSVGINSPIPFGISVSNVNFAMSGKQPTGLAVWNNAARVANFTMDGPTTSAPLSGNATGQSQFDNLKILHNNQGMNVIPGIYQNCVFDMAGGVQVNANGTYVFDRCSITGATNILRVNTASPDVTVSNSTLEMTQNAHWVAAIYVESANKFNFLNNTLLVNHLTQAADALRVVSIGGARPSQIAAATITGNTIQTNLAVPGIDLGAASDAPPYDVENNTLYKAKLLVQPKDINANNKLN